MQALVYTLKKLQLVDQYLPKNNYSNSPQHLGQHRCHYTYILKLAIYKQFFKF